MSVISRFHGPNAGYVLELYDRYLANPDSVDPAWRSFFEQWRPETSEGTVTSVPAGPAVDVAKVVGATKLAQSIRQRGHRAARLNPLGDGPPGDPALDPATYGLTDADLAALSAEVVGGPAANGAQSATDAIARLRSIYQGAIGYDFDHVQNPEERAWLYEAVESGRYTQPLGADEKRALLSRLTQVEALERFLHRAFVGQKRFSIEGSDVLVPMLDRIVAGAAATGMREVIMGMAHRGRLNTLVHVLGKPYEQLIAEFMGGNHREPVAATEGGNTGWTGDVKYHLGAHRPDGEIHLTLASNPSHLEFVNPVVQGMARASQERRDQAGPPQQDVDACLPILLHGDAAFPGEGVAAESLNLSGLTGYQTGGAVHLIVNNQIGFTTEPWQGRSTLYASDLARGFEIPVVHVNADDPEACLAVAQLAFDYRQQFHRDFLIDLIGYRRWGHNEGDEPGFTQPQMYAEISEHPTARELLARELDRQSIVPIAEAESMLKEALNDLQRLREKVARDGKDSDQPVLETVTPPTIEPIETAVRTETLKRLNQEIHTFPDGFTVNPKLKRNIQRRVQRVDDAAEVDWAHAEALAFAAILADGTPIRMAGQDTERGTFSQRHLVFHDVKTGETVVPLQTMPSAESSFAVYNSPLSETAALGFEHGYSIHAPEALVLWEAQFGDFANAGQVIIDQFIAAARAKWNDQPSLVLLLPHGYEGQGPEHSSGRLERFLQLAASDNLRIANCTTAAQYFHVLRKQAKLLPVAPRPLVIMTPKSLLRHPRAMSPVEEFVQGTFRPVLDDPVAVARRDEVTRMLFCSGKVYVDLVTSEWRESADHVAIVRVEQLYPFPEAELRQALGGYPNLQELVWLQEEPRNMGAWSYMEPRLRKIASETTDITYIGRPEQASPAEGLSELHEVEQARIIEEAFHGMPVARLKTYGVKHAD